MQQEQKGSLNIKKSWAILRFAHDSLHTLFDVVYPFFIKSPPAFQA